LSLDQRFEPLQRESQMGAALGGDQGVDLVDDDGLDGAEAFGGVRCEDMVERLGGGDEDVGRVAAEALAFALGRIAGANADLRFVKRDAAAAGHVGDPCKRRSEVTLHVDGQSLERGDVEDSRAL
jgi:hypothetical protein